MNGSMEEKKRKKTTAPFPRPLAPPLLLPLPCSPLSATHRHTRCRSGDAPNSWPSLRRAGSPNGRRRRRHRRSRRPSSSSLAVGHDAAACLHRRRRRRRRWRRTSGPAGAHRRRQPRRICPGAARGARAVETWKDLDDVRASSGQRDDGEKSNQGRASTFLPSFFSLSLIALVGGQRSPPLFFPQSKPFSLRLPRINFPFSPSRPLLACFLAAPKGEREREKERRGLRWCVVGPAREKKVQKTKPSKRSHLVFLFSFSPLAVRNSNAPCSLSVPPMTPV